MGLTNMEDVEMAVAEGNSFRYLLLIVLLNVTTKTGMLISYSKELLENIEYIFFPEYFVCWFKRRPGQVIREWPNV